ncbi:interleukin-12 receptor subunit beta-2 [Trichomycterus rosablanca]|uniref:interleukin-12 receptor subunit beta-2 n=1 Tax=Trichomycterus rosablanca TaxID=2290929 RepID=UPI002F356E5E
MPPKCCVRSICVRSIFMLLLLWSTGAPAEEVCSVHSSKEVHMGSSFQIFCIFRKNCDKFVYRDEKLLNDSSQNSTAAIVKIVNLTRRTTFTCKCNNMPEPCGTDIIPGYPPAVPQNLTCVQEGEFGKVNCTWKTGWETHVRTNSCLWLQGDRPVNCTSVVIHEGTRSALFPVSETRTHISVWVNASNSLGSATSAIHTFSLSDIVKPLRPHIKSVKCTSRRCQLYPDKAQNIQLVEIQYRVDQGHWSTISFNHTSSRTNWTVAPLNPYSLYTFQIRWKFSPARGLWSEWTRTEHWTDEEAPAKMLDAWYFEEPTKSGTKTVQLIWKELSKADARGKILQYNVSVIEQGKINKSTSIKSTQRAFNVSCFPCNVSISAINSKGPSPVRLVHLHHIAPLPVPVSYTRVSNNSVALSWPRPFIADSVREFLVEWHPAGHKHQLQWIRVQHHINTVNITGLQATECYEGAVIYLHSSGTKKAVFGDISTWEMAPQQGPECTFTIVDKGVKVKWSEVPLNKRGGCLINYTIYLEDSDGKILSYNVSHPKREFTISDLTFGQRYKLRVSAWTKAGEGPKGRELPFKLIRPGEALDEKPLALVLSVVGAVFLICLLCIYQFPSVQRRLSHCCYCLMPSIVPDPANSKWAKECAEGEMKLHLHLNDSTISEEEPDTVEVQEFPQEELLLAEIPPANETLHSEKQQVQQLRVPSASYQSNITSPYLKSFSHESSSSDATQASRGTDITVDYISTHGAMSEEDDNEEEMEVFGFFPCPQSPFLEPLMSVGGKLTLDSVKIDCSDFLDCT